MSELNYDTGKRIAFLVTKCEHARWALKAGKVAEAMAVLDTEAPASSPSGPARSEWSPRRNPQLPPVEIPEPDEVLLRLPETPRKVALAAARGLSNAQIGAELHLSVATVKPALQKVFRAYGLHSRAELAALLYRHLGEDAERPSA